MSFLSRDRWRFRGRELEESTEYLVNPACGWCRIYPFALEKEPDFGELYWCLQEKESLVQAVILIGAYREGPIPEEALERLAKIFSFFRNNGKEMILRIAYDGTGQGLMAEPDQMQIVLTHMQQLGPVVSQSAEDILTAQGFFIGSWGEMHDSRYLSKEKLCVLSDTWRKAAGEKITIAVRTPWQWRMLSGFGTKPGTNRMCVFNDGMFGSQTDLGTYGVKKRTAADWEESWCRADELDFLQEMNRALPYGGEAVGTAQEGSLKAAAAEMKRTYLRYLNATHDEKCLGLWKQELWEEKGVFKGVNGYDYIGTHMGCRPVIRKVSGKALKGLHLEIVIENIGFAYLLEEAEAVITAKAGERVKETVLPIQPQDLAPDKPYSLVCQLREETQDGEYQVFLQLRRKRDRKTLHFANVGEEGKEKVCIGWYSSC